MKNYDATRKKKKRDSKILENLRFTPEGDAAIVVGAQTCMTHHQVDQIQLETTSAQVTCFNQE